jgi:hypothetical protein
MKKLFLFFNLFLSLNLSSQTVIEFDNMETWSWPGVWGLTGGNPAITLTPNGGASTWAANASVTPSESAVLFGAGNGSSFIEQDWYVLPNITGLDATKQYQFRFRLASYTFTAPTAATRGVDIADFVDVQVSTDGGTTYISELRITGNSNSRWDYTATGMITHIANGSFTNSAAPTGDVYQAPAGINTTGPSTVMLDLPLGITQVTVDILCRVNSNGEEWWLDNIELVEINSLPVELISFEGMPTEKGNLLVWKTASEHNSSHYLIEKSTTGYFNENSIIGQKPAAGNSTTIMTYTFIDNDFESTFNYYRLTQVDNDGKFKVYDPILIDNSVKQKTVVKTINMMGQECVPNTIHGMYFEVYDDGTIKKVWRN